MQDPALCLFELVDLVDECIDALKFLIYRRKTNVCHLIYLLEFIHYEPSYDVGLDLLLHSIAQTSLNIVSDPLNIFIRDSGLLASLHDAVDDLVFVKTLTCAVLLDYNKQRIFDLLKCCESLLALSTLSSSSCCKSVFYRSRIYNFRVLMITVRAFHRKSPPSFPAHNYIFKDSVTSKK